MARAGRSGLLHRLFPANTTIGSHLPAATIASSCWPSMEQDIASPTCSFRNILMAQTGACGSGSRYCCNIVGASGPGSSGGSGSRKGSANLGGVRFLPNYSRTSHNLVPALVDRRFRDEQAKQVAPGVKQSPIAIMSINPAYELHDKPLILDYPATVENSRLNNTGFSWEVKIPYQVSMTTALYGAHLNQSYRYRLDQFHCHWGDGDRQGSEHTVDNRVYSAELHFVHYNMEKYHTLSKAARHPDGLVVMSVFLEAQTDHHNHAELEKVVSHLKSIQLKGEHTTIRQAIRIENLLPRNRSYWSYQGSLTTPPYLESVTWFVLKYPIRCNANQIERFKSLKSSIRRDDDQVGIRSNCRQTQPLNGRTIVSYDESMSTSSVSVSSINSNRY